MLGLKRMSLSNACTLHLKHDLQLAINPRQLIQIVLQLQTEVLVEFVYHFWCRFLGLIDCSRFLATRLTEIGILAIGGRCIGLS